MTATHLGCLTFEVTSEADLKIIYQVDLLAHDRNGFCSCMDFSTRHQPMVIREEGISRCKHINFAREVALDDFLKRVQKYQNPL